MRISQRVLKRVFPGGYRDFDSTKQLRMATFQY